MSQISGANITAALKSLNAKDTKKVATPADALKRLQLRGPASAEWEDIVKLDASGVERVAREIDDERVALQDAYEGAGNADKALQQIQDILAEADKLAAANGKSGTAKRTRRENQAKLDKLLKDIESAADEAKLPSGDRLLDGGRDLIAGKDSRKTATLQLDRVAPDSLGEVVVDGRTMTLADVARRKPLDTSTGKRSDVADARRSIETAQKSVADLRQKIQTFQKDELRPRLGDVATAMEGVFTSTSLGSDDEAFALARELRTMMLQSATLATAIAADDWDRERTIDLLT
jgi:flagellin-like hook-associated protein FlgL